MKNTYRSDGKAPPVSKFIDPMPEIRLVKLEVLNKTLTDSLSNIRDDLRIIKNTTQETKNDVNVIKSNYATRDYVLGKILASIGITATIIGIATAIIISTR